jgi:hypothetical protein
VLGICSSAVCAVLTTWITLRPLLKLSVIFGAGSASGSGLFVVLCIVDGTYVSVLRMSTRDHMFICSYSRHQST